MNNSRNYRDMPTSLDSDFSREYSPEVLADIKVATSAAVRWFSRKGAPIRDWRDLYHEGWCASLEALPRFDPDKGDLRAYLFGTLKRALGNAISREITPLSLGGRWTMAKYRQRAEDVDIDAISSAVPTPESIALGRERINRSTKWRLRFYRIVDSVLGQLGEVEATYARHLNGLDGLPEIPSREVARLYDVPVRDVYKAQSRFQSALQVSVDLYILNRQSQEDSDGENESDTST